jgi:hypothetical protein
MQKRNHLCQRLPASIKASPSSVPQINTKIHFRGNEAAESVNIPSINPTLIAIRLSVNRL